MSTVLILTVVVLVGVAIWQMGKIFEISQLGAKSKVHSGVANDEDNKYNGLLIFLFLVFIYGITIFSFARYTKFLLPVSASEHGLDTDQLMWISMVIIMIVQTITYTVLKRILRGRKWRLRLTHCTPSCILLMKPRTVVGTSEPLMT